MGVTRVITIDTKATECAHCGKHTCNCTKCVAVKGERNICTKCAAAKKAAAR